jgi:Zn ribbon nucleic-acid-binding protein
MLKEKDKYICPICKEFTSPDEWADNNSCINCGPVNTDSSKGIEKSVIQGEKRLLNT